MSAKSGTLYSLPTFLCDAPSDEVLPRATIDRARGLAYFIVESAKTARSHLKRIGHPLPVRELDIREIPRKAASRSELDALLQPLVEGGSAGLLSEAGCPGVADPGAALIGRAHELGVSVVPMTGPSSILLALMGSGLNGQHFEFLGYLPVKPAPLKQRLAELERKSRREGCTEIFIETPYRSASLMRALLEHLQPATRLCVASRLTCSGELVVTKSVEHWRAGALPEISGKPTVFLVLAQP